MKKIGFLMMVCAFAGQAHADQQRPCGAYLDAQVQTYAVEKQHIVDICTPPGETVKEVKVGDATVWRYRVNRERGEIDLSPFEAGSLTNMIVNATAGDGVEKRYEVRLISIDPDKRVGKRLPGKPNNP